MKKLLYQFWESFDAFPRFVKELKWQLSDYWNMTSFLRVKKPSKTVIHHTVKIDHPENFEILGNSRIDKGGRIRGKGEIRIGANTQIAEGVFMISENHDDYIKYHPFKERTLKPIRIGNHVWIGADAKILGGSKIGDRSIVGAGSVVRGVFGADCLLVGNPAKVVKWLCVRELNWVDTL